MFYYFITLLLIVYNERGKMSEFYSIHLALAFFFHNYEEMKAYHTRVITL